MGGLQCLPRAVEEVPWIHSVPLSILIGLESLVRACARLAGSPIQRGMCVAAAASHAGLLAQCLGGDL